MWVSRKKWDEYTEKIFDLQDKIVRLERDLQSSTHVGVFRVKTKGANSIAVANNGKIHIKDVLRHIMDRIGVDLYYVPGVSSSITMARIDGVEE